MNGVRDAVGHRKPFPTSHFRCYLSDYFLRIVRRESWNREEAEVVKSDIEPQRRDPEWVGQIAKDSKLNSQVKAALGVHGKRRRTGMESKVKMDLDIWFHFISAGLSLDVEKMKKGSVSEFESLNPDIRRKLNATVQPYWLRSYCARMKSPWFHNND